MRSFNSRMLLVNKQSARSFIITLITHISVLSPVEFVFHHYDEDKGGTLELGETQKIIEDMYGRDFRKFKEPRK